VTDGWGRSPGARPATDGAVGVAAPESTTCCWLTWPSARGDAGDVHRFPSAKPFLAHFGWCPAATQSGADKDAHPRLSKAGNHYVHQLIWMLAIHTVSQPSPYRDYFQQRTAAGKHNMDTLVAVGRKLLATIYAIRKFGQPYDPAYRPACLTSLSAAP
jgi:hypothetical protein